MNESNKQAVTLIDEYYKDPLPVDMPEVEPFKIGDEMTERQNIITATEGPVPGEFDRRIYGEPVSRVTEQQIEDYCKKVEDRLNVWDAVGPNDYEGVQIIRQLQGHQDKDKRSWGKLRY